jgi:hypothetical protein
VLYSYAFVIIGFYSFTTTLYWHFVVAFRPSCGGRFVVADFVE